MLVHKEKKENKMFMPYVFIMFAYEMTSEARLITKKLCLPVELTVSIHIKRAQLTPTPLM